jgi:hypothetical protein
VRSTPLGWRKSLQSSSAKGVWFKGVIGKGGDKADGWMKAVVLEGGVS